MTFPQHYSTYPIIGYTPDTAQQAVSKQDCYKLVNNSARLHHGIISGSCGSYRDLQWQNKQIQRSGRGRVSHAMLVTY